MSEATETATTSATVKLLQDLIRLDTVNPPGNERPAIELVERILRDAGFECETFALDPERPNLVATLRGPQDGPVLGYLSHVDTVLANAEDWSVDPWSGALSEGFVWGRGALDMKSQTAAEVVAAAQLAKSGFRPARGALKVIVVSDEESGGALGAQFLTEQHPEAAYCDFLVNEGAGEIFEYRGQHCYSVSCAEKGVARFAVSTKGVAGHAAIPKLSDNALIKLTPLVERIANAEPNFVGSEVSRACLQALGEDPSDPQEALARIAADNPQLALLIEPILQITYAPTMIRASQKLNVIPAHAELKVDCRVPPGLTGEEALQRARDILGPAEYEIRLSELVEGNESVVRSPLMDAIDNWLNTQDPGAVPVPTMVPGFTDSNWFRRAFPNLVAYGFFPQRHMNMFETAPLVHAADERIDVRDLDFATQFFMDLPVELLGA